jgi:diguanylate cyclase (GGDEF)-like protein
LSLRFPLAFAAPGALAALPLAAGYALAADDRLPAFAAPGYAYVALGVVALLGWRFRRSRAVAAAAALALLHAALVARGSVAAPLSAMLLAPALAAIAWGADRRTLAPRSLFQLALAPGIAAAASAAAALHPDPVASWLRRAPVPALPERIGALPQGALAPALLGLAALLALALLRRRSLEAGLFWAGVAGTGAAIAADGTLAGLWILAGGVALGVGLVETAYGLAFRDELTGLPGRRALAGALEALRPPYAVAIVDVDHFKRCNDRHGHDVGDQVLRMVASRLAAVGGGGRAFRTGGEEFTLLFAGRTAGEALPHLEALRRAVAASRFALRGPLRASSARGASGRGRGGSRARTLRVTVSAGVAGAAGRSSTPEQVVKAADRALYRAKRGGRNRVDA